MSKPYQIMIIGDEEDEEVVKIWGKLNDIGISPLIYGSIINARWYEELKFCGCGIPEEVQDYIHDILAAMAERSDSGWEINKVNAVLGNIEMATAFVLYTLDAMGLTEHGGSIFGSWLDPKGRALLKELAVEAKNRHDETNGE